jgi:hypothetical protein
MKPTTQPSDGQDGKPQPPERLVRLREPERVAAGIPAIYQAMKHVMGQDGLVKGTRPLLRLPARSLAWGVFQTVLRSLPLFAGH